MKKLSILLVVGFALTLFFSLHAGTVYAQCPGLSCTTWTASNVTFNVQVKKVVTNNQNVQSFVVKSYPFTGAITLFTDTADGDPTAGTVTAPPGLITAPETTTCYIGIVGTQLKDNIPIYVCISELVNVSADKPKGAGENAIIVGTGEVVSSTDTGLVFLQATWQETDVAGLPTSISLVSGKVNGGTEPPVGTTESTGGIYSASLPAIKFSKQ